MQKSLLKALGFMACLACSSLAGAVGLGGINVGSALGQPLKAEIELNSVDRADKSTLTARLASPEIFKNAGLDYPYGLPKLKFQIDTRPNGDPYILISSTQSVNEPFVSIMIEVTWASGRLLREYTFFLDPVGYSPEQPKVAEVKPIEPVVLPPASVPEQAPAVAEAAPVAAAPEAATVAPISEVPAPVVSEAAKMESAPVPVPVPVVPAPTPAPVPVIAEPSAVPAPVAPTSEKVTDSVSKAATSGPVLVVRGDTLTKIALENKSPEVSLERMLVALYRANADVFDGKNMNRLQAGKILRLPETEEIDKVKQAEAKKEIHVQIVDWNDYRQKLAAAGTAATEVTSKQEATGKIGTSITEKAPVKETAKEVLKLSKGEMPGDKAVVGKGGKSSELDKNNSKEEDAIAKAKALKESQDRTAMLEKNVNDLKKLAELKNVPPPGSTNAKSSVAAPVTAGLLAASAVVPESASSVAAAKSAVLPAKPKPVMPKLAAPAPQTDIIDDLLADPVLLGGALAALLSLVGLGFMLVRRKKAKGKAGEKKVSGKKVVEKNNDKKKSFSILDFLKSKFSKNKTKEKTSNATGRIATPVAPSPETGDFTVTAQSQKNDSNAGDELVDPISEADLFLTFGRDVQAEEVLKEALIKDPANLPVKLKLLEVYAGRKETDAFSTYAQQIKDSGNAPAWEQAAAMGRNLEPGNPLYGSGEGTGSAAGAAAPVVDLDVSIGGATNIDTPPANPFTPVKTIVLEPNLLEKTDVLTSAELQAAQATPMDFDITGNNPGKATGSKTPADEQTQSLNLDDLVFDVTGGSPQASAAVTAPVKPTDDSMAFTLDFPLMPSQPTVSKDIGLGEINLNLNDSGPSSLESGGLKDERWHEVATKLDLAKAYQEMGDAAGAKEILEEVLRDGDEQQRISAQALIEQLSV